MKALIVLFLFCSTVFADQESSYHSHEEASIVVNNRILAKVNDKTISVLDVMKKMDVFLSRNYPQVLEDTPSRFKFYISNWRALLDQMIDQELILADSNEKEIKASDTEIREQMMERFGPNIMSSLDKIGMNYEEARNMISSELIVQKMTWYRVNNKALQKVNSQDVKTAYLEYCAQNPPLEEWTYQVLSIRADTVEKSASIANQAYNLLKLKEATFNSIAEMLISENPNVSVSVSQDYAMTNKNISPAHKEVVAVLSPTSISNPVAQVSRVDGGTVYRIFLLKDYTFTPVPSFYQIADQLQQQLIQQSVAKETAHYIEKIRNHFGFDPEAVEKMIPSDFEPFALY